MKRITDIILFYLIVSLGQSFAQGIQQFEFTNNDSILLRAAAGDPDPYATVMPNIFRLSPDVASMTRYGDYPVNLNTGMVDISVPLGEVNQGSISVPVSIGYHASGRRIEDTGGSLGLGWSLKGGGVISRKVKGEPDDVNLPWCPYISNYESFYKTNSKYYSEVIDVTAENQYDIFTYVLPNGKSGKFIWKDVNGVKKAMTIPHADIKIDINRQSDVLSPTHNICTSMKITDTDGMQYLFGNAGGTTGFTERYHGSRYNCMFVSAWHLQMVVSSNLKDTVFFKYESGNNPEKTFKTAQSVTVYDETTEHYFLSGLNNQYVPSSIYLLEQLSKTPGYFCNKHLYNEVIEIRRPAGLQLTEVYGKTGKIKIFHEVKTPQINTLVNKLISSVEVQGSNNVCLKKIRFHLSRTSETGDNHAANLKSSGVRCPYFLDSLIFTDPSGKKGEKYAFAYNGKSGIGPYYARDWWGYYNGAGQESLIPLQTITVKDPATGNTPNTITIGDQYCNRNTNEQYMKQGMLVKVTYPTGGTGEFEYEANDYGISKCGGLRIKQIINTDGLGHKTYKTYTYGTGVLVQAFHPETYYEDKAVAHILQEDIHEWGYICYRKRVYTGEFPEEYSDLKSNTVTYAQVTEHMGYGAPGEARTEYEFYGEDDWDQTDVAYIRSYGYSSTIVGNPKIYIDGTRAWRSNNLKSKKVYKAGAASPIGESYYEYEDVYKDEAKTYLFSRYVDFSVQDLNERYQNWHLLSKETNWVFEGRTPRIYCSSDYTVTSGIELLSEERHIQDGVTTVKRYTYDSNYTMPIKETVTVRQGTYETRYSYPFSSSFKTAAPYNEMITRNMISPVVEQAQYKDGQFLQKIQTNYIKWTDANIIAPKSVLQQTKTQSSAEERIVYHKYDEKGNPVYITKDGFVKVFYIWGYNHQYPIAEIKNVDYATVTALISENTLKAIASKSEPSASDRQLIESLRTSLPATAEIITCVYAPMIGITSVTDSRNVKTTFGYDSFNRPENKKNDAGNIKESYEFYLKNR